jgi:hypothetical protein
MFARAYQPRPAKNRITWRLRPAVPGGGDAERWFDCSARAVEGRPPQGAAEVITQYRFEIAELANLLSMVPGAKSAENLVGLDDPRCWATTPRAPW